jgi:protein-tyrosine kinase
VSLVEKALKKVQRSVTAPAAPSGPGLSQPGIAVQAREHKHVAVTRESLRSQQMLPPVAQERQVSEEYRHIKRQLLSNALGRGVDPVPGGFKIMVTSAVPGEGKTYSSLNLALSFAQEPDYTVLLVDADVAKAHLSRLFGVEKHPGLLDAVSDESIDPEELIFDTDVPGLSFLPSGRLTESSGELLGSLRMERLLQNLSTSNPYRVILIDSSPLLLTNESRALAPLVGQVLVVIHAGSTPQRSVQDALSHLPEDKAIGLVLNQSEEAGRRGYYYYYGRPQQAEQQ